MLRLSGTGLDQDHETVVVVMVDGRPIGSVGWEGMAMKQLLQVEIIWRTM